MSAEQHAASCLRRTGATTSTVCESAVVAGQKTRSVRSDNDFFTPRALRIDTNHHVRHTLISYESWHSRRNHVRITCEITRTRCARMSVDAPAPEEVTPTTWSHHPPVAATSQQRMLACGDQPSRAGGSTARGARSLCHAFAGYGGSEARRNDAKSSSQPRNGCRGLLARLGEAACRGEGLFSSVHHT